MTCELQRSSIIWLNFFLDNSNLFPENSCPIDVSRLESVDGSIIVEGTTLESIEFPQLKQVNPKNGGRSTLFDEKVLTKP